MAKISSEYNITADFDHEISRTDQHMREAYEFLLHATIITCNEDLCDATLVFARDNTFMLVLKQDSISVAISYLHVYK